MLKLISIFLSFCILFTSVAPSYAQAKQGERRFMTIGQQGLETQPVVFGDGLFLSLEGLNWEMGKYGDYLNQNPGGNPWKYHEKVKGEYVRIGEAKMGEIDPMWDPYLTVTYYGERGEVLGTDRMLITQWLEEEKDYREYVSKGGVIKGEMIIDLGYKLESMPEGVRLFGTLSFGFAGNLELKCRMGECEANAAQHVEDMVQVSLFNQMIGDLVGEVGNGRARRIWEEAILKEEVKDAVAYLMRTEGMENSWYRAFNRMYRGEVDALKGEVLGEAGINGNEAAIAEVEDISRGMLSEERIREEYDAMEEQSRADGVKYYPGDIYLKALGRRVLESGDIELISSGLPVFAGVGAIEEEVKEGGADALNRYIAGQKGACLEMGGEEGCGKVSAAVMGLSVLGRYEKDAGVIKDLIKQGYNGAFGAQVIIVGFPALYSLSSDEEVGMGELKRRYKELIDLMMETGGNPDSGYMRVPVNLGVGELGLDLGGAWTYGLEGSLYKDQGGRIRSAWTDIGKFLAEEMWGENATAFSVVRGEFMDAISRMIGFTEFGKTQWQWGVYIKFPSFVAGLLEGGMPDEELGRYFKGRGRQVKEVREVRQEMGVPWSSYLYLCLAYVAKSDLMKQGWHDVNDYLRESRVNRVEGRIREEAAKDPDAPYSAGQWSYLDLNLDWEDRFIGSDNKVRTLDEYIDRTTIIQEYGGRHAARTMSELLNVGVIVWGLIELPGLLVGIWNGVKSIGQLVRVLRSARTVKLAKDITFKEGYQVVRGRIAGVREARAQRLSLEGTAAVRRAGELVREGKYVEAGLAYQTAIRKAQAADGLSGIAGKAGREVNREVEQVGRDLIDKWEGRIKAALGEGEEINVALEELGKLRNEYEFLKGIKCPASQLSRGQRILREAEEAIERAQIKAGGGVRLEVVGEEGERVVVGGGAGGGEGISYSIGEAAETRMLTMEEAEAKIKNLEDQVEQLSPRAKGFYKEYLQEEYAGAEYGVGEVEQANRKASAMENAYRRAYRQEQDLLREEDLDRSARAFVEYFNEHPTSGEVFHPTWWDWQKARLGVWWDELKGAVTTLRHSPGAWAGVGLSAAVPQSALATTDMAAARLFSWEMPGIYAPAPMRFLAEHSMPIPVADPLFAETNPYLIRTVMTRYMSQIADQQKVISTMEFGLRKLLGHHPYTMELSMGLSQLYGIERFVLLPQYQKYHATKFAHDTDYFSLRQQWNREGMPWMGTFEAGLRSVRDGLWLKYVAPYTLAQNPYYAQEIQGSEEVTAAEVKVTEQAEGAVAQAGEPLDKEDILLIEPFKTFITKFVRKHFIYKRDTRTNTLAEIVAKAVEKGGVEPESFAAALESFLAEDTTLTETQKQKFKEGFLEVYYLVYQQFTDLGVLPTSISVPRKLRKYFGNNKEIAVEYEEYIYTTPRSKKQIPFVVSKDYGFIHTEKHYGKNAAVAQRRDNMLADHILREKNPSRDRLVWILASASDEGRKLRAFYLMRQQGYELASFEEIIKVYSAWVKTLSNLKLLSPNEQDNLEMIQRAMAESTENLMTAVPAENLLFNQGFDKEDLLEISEEKLQSVLFPAKNVLPLMDLGETVNAQGNKVYDAYVPIYLRNQDGSVSDKPRIYLALPAETSFTVPKGFVLAVDERGIWKFVLVDHRAATDVSPLSRFMGEHLLTRWMVKKQNNPVKLLNSQSAARHSVIETSLLTSELQALLAHLRKNPDNVAIIPQNEPDEFEAMMNKVAYVAGADLGTGLNSQFKAMLNKNFLVIILSGFGYFSPFVANWLQPLTSKWGPYRTIKYSLSTLLAVSLFGALSGYINMGLNLFGIDLGIDHGMLGYYGLPDSFGWGYLPILTFVPTAVIVASVLSSLASTVLKSAYPDKVVFSSKNLSFTTTKGFARMLVVLIPAVLMLFFNMPFMSDIFGSVLQSFPDNQFLQDLLPNPDIGQKLNWSVLVPFMALLTWMALKNLSKSRLKTEDESRQAREESSGSKSHVSKEEIKEEYNEYFRKNPEVKSILHRLGLIYMTYAPVSSVMIGTAASVVYGKEIGLWIGILGSFANWGARKIFNILLKNRKINDDQLTGMLLPMMTAVLAATTAFSFFAPLDTTFQVIPWILMNVVTSTFGVAEDSRLQNLVVDHYKKHRQQVRADASLTPAEREYELERSKDMEKGIKDTVKRAYNSHNGWGLWTIGLLAALALFLTDFKTTSESLSFLMPSGLNDTKELLGVFRYAMLVSFGISVFLNMNNFDMVSQGMSWLRHPNRRLTQSILNEGDERKIVEATGMDLKRPQNIRTQIVSMSEGLVAETQSYINSRTAEDKIAQLVARAIKLNNLLKAYVDNVEGGAEQVKQELINMRIIVYNLRALVLGNRSDGFGAVQANDVSDQLKGQVRQLYASSEGIIFGADEQISAFLRKLEALVAQEDTNALALKAKSYLLNLDAKNFSKTFDLLKTMVNNAEFTSDGEAIVEILKRNLPALQQYDLHWIAELSQSERINTDMYERALTYKRELIKIVQEYQSGRRYPNQLADCERYYQLALGALDEYQSVNAALLQGEEYRVTQMKEELLQLRNQLLPPLDENPSAGSDNEAGVGEEDGPLSQLRPTDALEIESMPPLSLAAAPQKGGGWSLDLAARLGGRFQRSLLNLFLTALFLSPLGVGKLAGTLPGSKKFNPEIEGVSFFNEGANRLRRLLSQYEDAGYFTALPSKQGEEFPELIDEAAYKELISERPDDDAVMREIKNLLRQNGLFRSARFFCSQLLFWLYKKGNTSAIRHAVAERMRYLLAFKDKLRTNGIDWRLHLRTPNANPSVQEINEYLLLEAEGHLSGRRAARMFPGAADRVNTNSGTAFYIAPSNNDSFNILATQPRGVRRNRSKSTSIGPESLPPLLISILGGSASARCFYSYDPVIHTLLVYSPDKSVWLRLSAHEVTSVSKRFHLHVHRLAPYSVDGKTEDVIENYYVSFILSKEQRKSLMADPADLDGYFERLIWGLKSSGSVSELPKEEPKKEAEVSPRSSLGVLVNEWALKLKPYMFAIIPLLAAVLSGGAASFEDYGALLASVVPLGVAYPTDYRQNALLKSTFLASDITNSPTNTFSGTVFKTEYNGKEEIFGVVAAHAIDKAISDLSLQRHFKAVVSDGKKMIEVPAEIVQLSSPSMLDMALVKFPPEAEKLFQPLRISEVPVKFGEVLFSHGFAGNKSVLIPNRKVVKIAPLSLRTFIPYSRSDRPGLCGSAVLNENFELVGIHTGSSPDKYSEEFDIGYAMKASFLNTLVEAYHNGGKATFPLVLNSQKIMDLNVDEYISYITLYDKTGKLLKQQGFEHRFSFSKVQEMIEIYKPASISFVVRRAIWNPQNPEVMWEEHAAPYDQTKVTYRYNFETKELTSKVKKPH